MPELKPTEAFVGVVDLFAILLPGALLAAAIIVVVGSEPPDALRPLLTSTGAQWVGFALGSYALGHFAFLTASLLDEWVYDRFRTLIWPREQDQAYLLATELRKERFPRPCGVPEEARAAEDQRPWLLRPLGQRESSDWPMNTFAWAKAMMMLKAPGAFADVLRLEADSKFFRSMVVVLPVTGAIMAPSVWRPLLPIAMILATLSFLRYAERRHKSTEAAYRYVIVLCREIAVETNDAEGPAG